MSRRGRRAALGLAGVGGPGATWGYDPDGVVHHVSDGPAARTWANVKDSVGARLVLGLLTVLLAYHYSLSTLVHTLGLNTPLAYLGLVPLMAAGLAFARRHTATGPDIHDRQVDLIVGVTLVGGALLALLALPGRLGTLFWVWRLDLLTLPFFVAGVVTLLFGTRALWHYRVPVAFLALAWPQPYVWLIEHALDGAIESTLWGTRNALSVWHVATPQVGGDGSVFLIDHKGAPFPVSVASACAGVNSQIGFLLVAAAALALVRGRWFARVSWLALGLGLVWALNVFRLVFVMWTGKVWGERVAVDGFHPYVGLVVFGLGVTAMSLAMPLFGLRTVASTKAAPVRSEGTMDRLGGRVAALFNRTPLAASGLKLAAVACLLGTLVAAVTNADLRQYRLVASEVGGSRIVPYTTTPAVVSSATLFETNQYDWVTQYFGSSSSWHRYTYAPKGVQAASSGAGAIVPLRPVTADVIQGTDLNSFQDYGLEACYRFHGYNLSGATSVDLGNGVKGEVVHFRNPRATEDYVALWWVWSISRPDGRRAYERVVLLEPTGSGAAPTPESSPLKGVGYGDKAAAFTSSQADTDRAVTGVTALGKEIVGARVATALPSDQAARA